MVGNRPLGDYFSDTISPNASEDYDEVWWCYDQTSKGRRFAVTRKGFLRWIPDNIHGSKDLSEHAMTGGLVAVILDVVHRSCFDHTVKIFKVVGETYIHGIMDGEAMNFLKSGTCQIRDFTLC